MEKNLAYRCVEVLVNGTSSAIEVILSGRNPRRARTLLPKDYTRGENGISLRRAVIAEAIVAGDNLCVTKKDGVNFEGQFTSWRFENGRVVYDISTEFEGEKRVITLRSRDIEKWEAKT